MEDLKIRKIIFDVEGKNKYNYDVIQGIKIIDLKRMLDMALQMSRFKMILSSEGKDYTNQNDAKIENLFPMRKEIIFSVSFQEKNITEKKNQYENQEIDIFLPKKKSCPKHENKFLSHFCFDCNTSFCSVCHKNGEHLEHESIEKYDYLLDPEIIVERIFRKITDEINNLKSDKDRKIADVEKRINEIFTDLLRNLIMKLEERAKSLLRFYGEVYDNSQSKLKSNLIRVKEICTEVLIDKKDELGMQKLISDDQVVIAYYNTILQIYNQRKPFNYEITKLFDLEKSFVNVNCFIEKTNCYIENFFNSTMSNNQEFINCQNEIKKNEIKDLSREKIKKNLEMEIIQHKSNAPLPIDDYLELSPQDKSVKQSAYKSIGKKHHLDEIVNMAYLPNMQNAPVTRIDFTSEKKNFENNNNNNINYSAISNNNTISQKKMQENINRIGDLESHIKPLLNSNNLKNQELLNDKIQNAQINLNKPMSHFESNIQLKPCEIEEEKDKGNLTQNDQMEIEQPTKPSIAPEKTEKNVSNITPGGLFNPSFNFSSNISLPKNEVKNVLDSSAASLAKKDPSLLFGGSKIAESDNNISDTVNLNQTVQNVQNPLIAEKKKSEQIYNINVTGI